MPLYENGKLISQGDGYPAVRKATKKVTATLALTQAEYDALPNKDRNTLYIIIEAR